MARRLRIITGLIIFAFVTGHLINISLGLWSTGLMERARPIFMGLWGNWVGGTFLALALSTHVILGLLAIYRRNTLQVSREDGIQIISSLVLLPLLVPHFVGTAIAAGFFSLPQNYPGLLLYFWQTYPGEGLRQVLLMAIAWIHGCIGLFTWLKLQPWWRRVAPLVYPLAVALPVLAMLAYVEGGKEVMSGQVEVTYAQPPAGGPGFDEILARLETVKWTLIWLFVAGVAVTLIARAWRLLRNEGLTRVKYVGQEAYIAGNGMTLLESARVNEIPHASKCGGRGRCGTCRVRVLDSSRPLPEISEAEHETLDRFEAETGVRLACQLKLAGGRLEVERLLSPHLVAANLTAEAERGEHPDRKIAKTGAV